MYVFVYGTLRKGDCRFGVLKECECIAEEAYLDEFFMVSLGGFPGILPGKGRVRGEVYDVNEETLSILDGIEGYREDDPKNSLYTRQVVQTFLANGEKVGDCFTYIFNASRSSRERKFNVIESGDWFDERPPRARTY